MVEINQIGFDVAGKKVQKAGFRSAIEDIAIELSITGRVKNNAPVPDESGLNIYSVNVLAEGKKEDLKKFIEKINKINTFHKVNEIDLKVLDSAKHMEKREFPEFEIVRKEGEASERMDEAVFYVKDIYKGIRDMKEETHENFQTMEKKYHTISNNLNFFVEVIAAYAAATNPELKEPIEKLKEKYKHEP